MAFNYTKSKAQLDRIANQTERNRENLVSMQATGIRVESDLNGMLAQYGGLVSEINQAAANNPLDPAIQALKAEKDKLVADFQALKTIAGNINTALASHVDPIK